MTRTLMILISLIMTLAACSDVKPMKFPSPTGYKEGPGLISGEKGQFEIPLSIPDCSPPLSEEN